MQQPSRRRCSSAGASAWSPTTAASCRRSRSAPTTSPGSATRRTSSLLTGLGDAPADARGALRLRGRRPPAAARRGLAEAHPRAAGRRRHRALRDRRLRPVRAQDQVARADRHLRRRLRRATWRWRCASATASSARRTTSRAATARSTTRTWACRNGIDLNRYAHRRARPRTGVTIGWAGGVGHKASLARWEPAIRDVLRARPETRASCPSATGAAAAFIEEFGPERAIALPPARRSRSTRRR